MTRRNRLGKAARAAKGRSHLGDQDEQRAGLDPAGLKHGDQGLLVEAKGIIRRGQGGIHGPAPAELLICSATSWGTCRSATRAGDPGVPPPYGGGGSGGPELAPCVECRSSLTRRDSARNLHHPVADDAEELSARPRCR